LGAVAGLVASSVYLGRVPGFSVAELEVLLLLWVLLVVVRGLERSGLLRCISGLIERGGLVSLKLVGLTFGLSMFVTNDVALVVVVPLTLALGDRRVGALVILEALAANAGAALTPLGSPQNLYIYWVYGVDPRVFVGAIAPFSVVSLAVLLGAGLLVRSGEARVRPAVAWPGGPAWVYAGLLVLVVLAVVRVVPVWVGMLVPLWVVVRDRGALRVDYGLLLMLGCMFGLMDNLGGLLAARLEHAGHVFLLSALASQFMSNVPAAILFAEFTSDWKALLWGVSVGGFGSLVASLANLIAYRLYVREAPAGSAGRFTLWFLGAGYAMFLLGLGLYGLGAGWLGWLR